MCGVEDQADIFIANKLGEAFSPAITTDTHLAGEVGRHTAHTGQTVEMFRPQCAGDGQRFRYAAQQQDAFHNGLTTSSSVIGSAWRQVSNSPNGWACAT